MGSRHRLIILKLMLLLVTTRARKFFIIGGGVYLDTDVELFDSFRRLIDDCQNILGFETSSQVGTAVMGFTPGHPVIGELLRFYESNEFRTASGKLNTIANVSMLTDILRDRGLAINGERQIVGDITVYSREYFYPKKLSDSAFKIVPETVAVHKCSNSWMTGRERRRGKNILWIKIARPILRRLKATAYGLLGRERAQHIEVWIRNALK